MKTTKADADDTVTIAADLVLPRRYKEFYDRLIELGDIGSIAEIAADGVVCYLNRIYNELSSVLIYHRMKSRKTYPSAVSRRKSPSSISKTCP